MGIDRRRIAGLLVIALATTLWLPACTRVSSMSGWGTAHEMTIARVNDPPSLNPLFVADQGDIDATQLYAEPLVGLSPSNALIPIVASRVPTVENGDVSRDGRTVTYHLRRDERFADGVPLTSSDVLFTYRAIVDPRNPTTEVQPYRIISRIDATDPHTVVLHLRRPWSAAVATLFAATDFIYGILPSHAFSSTALLHAGWNDRPFGSGPFCVVRWNRGESIVLEPNPYARRRPHLHRVTLKIVPDQNTELLLLRTHAVDVMDSLDDSQAHQAQNLVGIHLVRTPENAIARVLFNTRRAPTDDLRVRRALLEAVDTQAIRRKVFYGYWPQATTEIAPVLWAHDATILGPVYDPSRALHDLEIAGWRVESGRLEKAGLPLEVQLAYGSSDEESAAIATLVQADLARIGVEAIVRGYPWSVYNRVPDGVLYGGRFNLVLDDYGGGSDPEQSESTTCDRAAPKGPNFARWCNPAYDRLFSEQATQTNRSSRMRTFYEMQRILKNSAIFVPLVYAGLFSATNPAVRGWKPNMLYEFSNSEDWDVLPR